MTGPSGLVVVDKPAGMTSHDVVARVRRVLGTRKVGHAGTLDPMATGVLVLGVGRATRLLGHLTLTDKAYEATIRLGARTTTDDADGDVVETVWVDSLADDAIGSGLARMVGEIDQRPSSVSAIKVDGKRAYARVRAGEDVELPARRVRIDAIDVLDVRHGEGVVDVDVAVRCSSGTYVRAIARDLGEALGVGGHLTALRRTAVGPFTLARANADLEHPTVIPIGDAARAAFPSVELTADQARDVRFGRKLAVSLGDGPHAVFSPDGEFLALYEPAGELARAVAVFG
jgi:tRNA pseudouridine55 synthase